MHEHRRRQPRARRFGQHAGDVVERRDPVEAHVAPAGIDRRSDHAGLAGGFELVAHVRAPPRHLAPHQRIAIGTDRLGVRRDVEARVAAAHLVMIDVGLRHPVAVHQLAEVLRLGQVQREAVAVVVVAGVLLVEPRQAGRFVRRADVLHVPVGDHLRAVRIDRRHDDADDVVEDARALPRRCASGCRRRIRPPSARPPPRSSAARTTG